MAAGKPKSRDISLFDQGLYYRFEYGFYSPIYGRFLFDSCRAHNVWAMMSFMQNQATFEKYCFQNKKSVIVHLGGKQVDQEYLDKLKNRFTELESKFKINPVKFSATETKNKKFVIKIDSGFFWIKSLASYSLFLLLLRSADESFLNYNERIPKIVTDKLGEFINVTKIHTQKFGWSIKEEMKIGSEICWDNKFHSFGIVEFLEEKDGFFGEYRNLLKFSDLKKYKKAKENHLTNLKSVIK